LVTNVVIRATMCFNLQCNNVARQVEEKCCLYYRTFRLCYKSRYTGCQAHQNSHYGGNSEVFSHINKDLISLSENKNNFDCWTWVFCKTCPADGLIDTAKTFLIVKICLDILHGHCLFLKTHNFHQASLTENCSLLGAVMSLHIFAPTGGYCLSGSYCAA